MRYSADHIFDYIELTEDYSIFETAVPKAWVGKSIVELAARQKYCINILATRRGGKLEPMPGPAHCFTADETIFILGSNEDTQKFLRAQYPAPCVWNFSKPGPGQRIYSNSSNFIRQRPAETIGWNKGEHL